MPHSPGIGAIFGIVSENGIAKPSGRVGLYDRTTMALVTKTVADSLGGYVFTGLNQLTNDYLVMALDDDGAPPKNALVQDYIQPIPAHMGATSFSNWELRSRRLNPAILWIPRVQSTAYYETLGGGAAPQTRSKLVGTFSKDQPTITPGAPHYPAMKLTTGAIGITAFQVGFVWPMSGVDTFSIEAVFDTSFDSQFTFGGWVTGGYQRQAHLAGFSWTVSTKTFRVSSSILSGYEYYLNLTDTSKYNTGVYVASGLPAGVHHVVVTYTLASAIRIYVDGALVSTVSIAGTNAWISSIASLYDDSLYIGGINNASGNCLFGPVAVYHGALDATTITGLYNDLMIGTSPASTGYVREILTDHPALLYRLGEGSYGTASEYLTNLASATHHGTLTFAAPSPVMGGTMTHFGSVAPATTGGLFSPRGSGGGSPLQRSWEFWVNTDTSTPSALRTLFMGRQVLSGANNWWKVMQVTTTGALRLVVWTNAVETIDFTYSPPAGVTKHIVLALDKAVTLTCKLYVNGVLQETQPTSGSNLSEGNLGGSNTPLTDTAVSVGANISDTGVLTEGFVGYLSEVALYYRLLSPSRIQAHYDARLLT